MCVRERERASEIESTLTLGSWEAVLGPSKRMTIVVQQGVLLLNAEPGLGFFGLFHDLIAGLAPVGL